MLYSSQVQQPMRATAVLGERPHTRWAAPVDREQGRAAGLHPDAPHFPAAAQAMLPLDCAAELRCCLIKTAPLCGRGSALHRPQRWRGPAGAQAQRLRPPPISPLIQTRSRWGTLPSSSVVHCPAHSHRVKATLWVSFLDGCASPDSAPTRKGSGSCGET
jgi:hypothetical protein